MCNVLGRFSGRSVTIKTSQEVLFKECGTAKLFLKCRAVLKHASVWRPRPQNRRRHRNSSNESRHIDIVLKTYFLFSRKGYFMKYMLYPGIWKEKTFFGVFGMFSVNAVDTLKSASLDKNGCVRTRLYDASGCVPCLCNFNVLRV